MKEINLIPGTNETSTEGAFDGEKMKRNGVDSMLLSQALSKALTPFASLLSDGCGFAVINKGDGDVSVIGVTDLPED